MLFFKGPQPLTHAQRGETLAGFLQHLEAAFPGQILCACLYGSMARETDGPHSDIELFCVLDRPGYEENLEWVYGAGKAEINLQGADIAQHEAEEVDEFWALSHGKFIHNRLLAGDARVQQALRAAALSPALEQIQSTVRAALVGELYEWVGKLRNSQTAPTGAGLPELAVKFTEMTALLLGLANRKIYTTGMSMLSESLQLPNLPNGYAGLCQQVLSGELADRQKITESIEMCFAGLAPWAAALGAHLEPAAWPFTLD